LTLLWPADELFEDFEDFEFHGSARGFDVNGFADAGFEQRISHRTGHGHRQNVVVAGLGFADEADELFGVIGEVQEFDGMSQVDDIVGDVVGGDDGDALELEFQFGDLALDIAVLFFSEVVFRVFRKVAEGGGFADAFLDVDLGFVEVFAFFIEGGFFFGADHLHDASLRKTGSNNITTTACAVADLYIGIIRLRLLFLKAPWAGK